MLDGNRIPESGSSLSDPWVYLAEVEHRVVNEYAMMVSTLSVAASRASSTDARQTLLGAAHRLHDLASVHRALQPPMTDWVDLFAYLRQFCDCIRRASLDDRGIELDLVGESIVVSVERCWSVGLIVSELITNAVRHGLKSGAIRIDLSRSDSNVRCIVSNDAACESEPQAGRGTRIVNALARDLGGFVGRHFSRRGATVLLFFPQHAAALRVVPTNFGSDAE